MAQLEYKTFDQLMASVEEDLTQYADNNLINRRNYIKVAKRINSDLGPKINRKSELCITVENFKAKVPLDLLNVLCLVATSVQSFGKTFPNIFGTKLVTNTTEELVDKGFTPTTCAARITCENNCSYITKITQTSEIKYNSFYEIYPVGSSRNFFDSNSPNISWVNSNYTLSMDESEMTFNFESGEIYLSYISNMTDEKGNLLVLDHDLVNGYYEASIKEKIFLDLWNNGEDCYQKYVDVRDVQLPKFRQEARRIVHTPEYKALRKHNDKILRDFYNEFFKMLA